MSLFAIPFPAIDPVAISFGPIAVRWYALAYIGGLLLGWWYARRLVENAALWGAVKRPSVDDLDDLLVYCAFGVVLGGRLGEVLFYNSAYYWANPGEILKTWNGGMSFHGGLIGAALAVMLFSWRKGLNTLAIFDLCSTVVPIGLLFGRIANFINGELWGRETDVAWGVIFPEAGPEARHPSQLYEAALEGLLLLIVLNWAARRFGFVRPGRLAGLFGIGYGLSRFIVEFFREPDEHLGFLFGGWLTMGMLLSLPMIVAGVGLWLAARARPAEGASPA